MTPRQDQTGTPSPTGRLWLFKSEPSTFSWQDLAASPQKTTAWEGVRNFQARNRLRDAVSVGDGVLFYHSSCPKPGIVGVARVVRGAYPDATQWVASSPYFDPRASHQNPRWYVVDVQLHFAFKRFVERAWIMQQPALEHLELCQRGSRLSIQVVDQMAWDVLLKRGGRV